MVFMKLVFCGLDSGFTDKPSEDFASAKRAEALLERVPIVLREFWVVEPTFEMFSWVLLRPLPRDCMAVLRVSSP